MDAAHQPAQFGERVVELAAGQAHVVTDVGAGAVLAFGQRERHAGGDDAGLGAVVQVAFDPPQFGGLGVDHPGPALGQTGGPFDQPPVFAGCQQRPGRPRLAPGQRTQQPTGHRQQGSPSRDSTKRPGVVVIAGFISHGAFGFGTAQAQAGAVTAPSVTTVIDDRGDAADEAERKQHHQPGQVPPGRRLGARSPGPAGHRACRRPARTEIRSAPRAASRPGAVRPRRSRRVTQAAPRNAGPPSWVIGRRRPRRSPRRSRRARRRRRRGW